MLLKLIKTRPMISGSHAEIWMIDHTFGNRKLANIFVLNEHLPIELIYPIRVSPRGIFIRKQHCGWQWDNPKLEQLFIDSMLEIQNSGEEIYLDVCSPEPDLPGYPHIDYHPEDFAIVFC